MCRLSWNLRASTYWKPLGLSRLVMGFFFLPKLNSYDFQNMSKFFFSRNFDKIFFKMWYFNLNQGIYIILNSVCQHNHFIIQSNYMATCFDYRLVILRLIFSIVSQDAMHTLGSHRVYIHGIHQIKHKRFNLMYSMDLNTMGSQSVHSILWHDIGLTMTNL